jgi:two-component system, response regulator
MGTQVLKNIILVDDSADDVQLFLRTCQQLDIQNPILTFDGAEAALAYLSNAENPLRGIIVLDLKMPGRDGFYVLTQLKAHPLLNQLVVVVLTTSSQLEDIVRAYALGANSFLTKPFDLQEFRQMVSAFHDHWIVRARIPVNPPESAQQTASTRPRAAV